MLPVIHENDVTFRKKLLQNVKHNKNPDFRINGEYWELESPSYPYKYNNIDARIRKGSLQADRLLLHFNKAVPYTLIEKVVSDRMRVNKDLKEVVIISKNKIEMHLTKKSRQKSFPTAWSTTHPDPVQMYDYFKYKNSF